MSTVPAIDRAVAVMEHLAERPASRFTLSELCRELDLSKATAHSLLAALCEHGWLARDPDTKTYGLGAGFAVLADRVSGGRRQLVDIARGEMQQLVEGTGARAVATTVVADHIVLLAVAGAERPFGTALREGQRLPLAPPLGAVFLAWADSAEVDRWLRRHRPDATEADLRRYRDAVDVVRRRGYAVSLESQERRMLGQALEEGTAPATLVTELDRGEYVLLDLEPDREYRVSMIAAPVFDERGGVAMAISLFDLPDEVAADRIVALAEKLTVTARTVTKHIGGRPLADHPTYDEEPT